MKRYFIGLFVVIILIIILIILIVGSGGKPKVAGAQINLVNYANTNAVAKLTIDGPVSAPQNHYQEQISVSTSSATIELIQGYNGNVIKSQSYANTEASYSVFLRAIDFAGFTLGNTAKNLQNENGYCPLGQRYIFEFNKNGQDMERFWSTDCGYGPHSFNGQVGLNLTLFERQIPNYYSFASAANF